MRYSIGSISKQFTAAAILILAEEGKLSLNDHVSKFVPGLTRGDEVTIRQILSHTSGYQDYWPQDYVPPFMLHPITAQQIMEMWARKPLDFEPGAEYQYSNTGFCIAGAIVEKAAGMPLWQFLDERIFQPLSMKSVRNIDQELLGQEDSTGYLRYGLGPLRVAPKEGKGWLFAAGELAMTAEDLAKWDISLIDQKLMKPSSYRELEGEARLNNGLGAHYALGLSVGKSAGRHEVSHSGEISGFCAKNMIFPEEKVAVLAFVNQDANDAASEVVDRVIGLLFTPRAPIQDKLDRDREVFKDLQQGKIDHSLFTEDAISYFSAEALHDLSASLKPLGTIRSFTLGEQYDRGGMHFRSYRVSFGNKNVGVLLFEMPDGKIEQYQVVGN